MDFNPDPSLFKGSAQPWGRYLLCMMLAIGLIGVDLRWHLLAPVQKAMTTAIWPLQWLATQPVHIFSGIGGYFTSLADLQKENRTLQQIRTEAAFKLLRLESLEKENEQLRQLLMLQRTPSGKGVVAEALYDDRDFFAARMVLNRGTAQGVQAGSVVVNTEGLVGQITQAQALTAQLTLIAHNTQLVPVQVLRNGTRAILFGNGRSKPLEIRYLPSSSDVVVGDVLVSSGLGGVYPPGLPVARVAQIEHAPGSAFNSILCQPLAHIDQNTFFLVLDAPPAPPPLTLQTAPAEPQSPRMHHKPAVR